MSESDEYLRNQTVKVLATIAEMYPSSPIAKKLDNGDEHTFESLIGIWGKAMNGISQQRVEKGLTVLMNSGNKFEPSLPEFMGMCKSIPTAHRPFKSLPSNHNKGAPQPGDPASISHYDPATQRQLRKLGMVPDKGETHSDYCLRCKKYVSAKFPERVGGMT